MHEVVNGNKDKRDQSLCKGRRGREVDASVSPHQTTPLPPPPPFAPAPTPLSFFIPSFLAPPTLAPPYSPPPSLLFFFLPAGDRPANDAGCGLSTSDHARIKSWPSVIAWREAEEKQK